MANMVITSVTVTIPSTTPIFPNENAVFLKINVFTTNPDNPLNIADINVDTGSTTLSTIWSDCISDINIYYTGAVNAFSTGTLFGTQVGIIDVGYPNGGNLILGTQTLLEGDNYFWVTLQMLPYLNGVVDNLANMGLSAITGAWGMLSAPGDFTGNPLGTRELQTMDGALPTDASTVVECDPELTWEDFAS